MYCLRSALEICWDSQQIVRLTVAVVSLNHCVQGQAEPHSVRHLRYIKNYQDQGTGLIIVFLLPRSYQVDRTCHQLYYLSWRITCSVTTELERLPTSLQDALQINPRRLKIPLHYCPVADIRVPTRTRIGPAKRQDIIVRIATSQVVFSAFAFASRQALHLLQA
jgi:hypothetical protein